MINKNKQCMLSVATYQYLPRAIMLADSFMTNNPGYDIFILMPDLSKKKVKSVNWPFASHIKILGLDEIEDPFIQKMHIYFNAFEMCCAAKSFLLEYALFKMGYERAVLLDPDILCYASFKNVWSAMETKDIALTPHIISPLPDDGFLPDDREFVNSGFINGGFWSAARTDATKKILEWIKKKVIHYGFFIPEINLYADQTWMSCLPWFFPHNTLIVQNHGMNVAYWNLHERTLTQHSGSYFSNDDKLIFFHFSGFDDTNPTRLTTHTLRKFNDKNNAIIQKLLEDYFKKLNKTIHMTPLMDPDLQCNNSTLYKRIKKYESVFGEKAKFINGFQNSLFNKSIVTLFNTIKIIIGKSK